MKRKNIDAMRETRLWLRDILVPLCAMMAIPEVREATVLKVKNCKDYIGRLIKRNENEIQ